jgi:hypothetical protein
MRMHASWFGVIHWIQGCGTSVLVPDSGLPSNFHPDHHQLAGVLGAVKGRPGNGREWGDARATAYLTAPARVGVWRAVARGGRSRGVRVIGPCKSACTVLLAHIPRSKICVMPAASNAGGPTMSAMSGWSAKVARSAR